MIRVTGNNLAPGLMNMRRFTDLPAACGLAARLALPCIVLGLVVAVLPASAADAAEITAIRVADHTRFQRVVIDATEAIKFRVLEDKKPLTLVLYDAQATPQALAWIDMGRLKGAWVVQADPKSVHISFDLSGPVRPRISKYAPDSYGGHRIVIDLWPISEPEYQRPVEPIDPHASVIHNSVVSSADEFWPDFGSTDDEDSEDDDLMAVPGLKVEHQWPDLVAEAQKIVEQDRISSQFPDPGNPAPMTNLEAAAGLALKPSLDAPVTDPVAAARRSLAQGMPGEACKVLQLNYPKGTWNIEAMSLQGSCLSELGKFVEASTLYTEILSFEPGNIEARLGLAKAQAKNGDLEVARDNYTRALEAMPAGQQAKSTRNQLLEIEDKIKHAVH
jgi:hypothetical protein